MLSRLALSRCLDVLVASVWAGAAVTHVLTSGPFSSIDGATGVLAAGTLTALETYVGLALLTGHASGRRLAAVVLLCFTTYLGWRATRLGWTARCMCLGGTSVSFGVLRNALMGGALLAASMLGRGRISSCGRGPSTSP